MKVTRQQAVVEQDCRIGERKDKAGCEKWPLTSKSNVEKTLQRNAYIGTMFRQSDCGSGPNAVWLAGSGNNS